MRIVCDSNVLVRAAINRTGLAAELLKLIRTSQVLVASAPLLAEVLQVLRRPRIQALHGLDEQGIRRFIKALYKASLIVQVPLPVPRVVPHDAKDDAILLTAIGGKADRLATRDQHLFHPEVIRIATSYGVRIISDDALLAELRKHRT